MAAPRIIWTKQAKMALKNIYNFYKPKSLQGAKNVISDILQSPKSIQFSKQYQLDEINPNYRRIVIRDYKLIYKERDNSIQIIDIVSTKQSPDKLKSK
ncbi:type II toxin-antitoxin system RelE/ParE family toxin [soil metagenome]